MCLRKSILWRTLPLITMATTLHCMHGQALAQQEERDSAKSADLIQGAVARSEAIFSGRIAFHSVILQNGQEDSTWTKEESFYFSGPSWAVYPKGADTPKEASHGGKYINHDATPQPDGRISHLARLKLGQPINFDYPHLPAFAGSFWWRATRDYVKQNARGAVSKGQVEVNGVSAHILEWVVPEADKFKAFDHAGGPTEHGGVLRLYVAPQLGYVLPRVDYIGTDGEVNETYDCSDFSEVAPGLFMPKRCRWLLPHSPGGGKIVVFDLQKVEKINEPIPDEVFKVYLPVGTAVIDGRSGRDTGPIKLKREGELPIEGAADLIAVGSPPPVWRRSLPVAIAIGVVVGLALAAVFIARHKRRAKPGVAA